MQGVVMKADEVLKLLEKHESECADRYKRIEQQLDRFDTKLWGLGVLIIASAFIPEVFKWL
jgi:hypothetical protein|tara:strand:+ start:72 stop:254 length:183 start_codon:yes stop_codon:yes gene_type:complete